MTTDREDWPTHKPIAPDAPIPGRHWFGGCEPADYDSERGYYGPGPRVNPDGVCEGCGETACPDCGAGFYPDGACQCVPKGQLTFDAPERARPRPDFDLHIDYPERFKDGPI